MNRLLTEKDGEQEQKYKKEIPMYFMKITEFADDLINDINKLTNWPIK